MFIDRLVRFVLPPQDLFFTLLEEIGAKMEAAAVIFGELVNASTQENTSIATTDQPVRTSVTLQDVAARIKPLETEADHLCHNLYDQLDRTFVTPIDREDLARLTNTLDDVIDGMEHTAAFAALFRFTELTPPMKQLIDITTRAVTELGQAVRKLRNFNDPESIRKQTVAVHTLENEADAVYRGAIAALFSEQIDPRELIRQKDMLTSLEMGIDVCEDAMDVIRSVFVKNG